MNHILVQMRLTEKEIERLLEEFPQYGYLPLSGSSYKDLSPDEWRDVEILYGNRLTVDELEKAKELRWIHTPGPHLHQLCLKEIVERGTILITTTIESNLTQIGEYVMSGILAFSKNLFYWQQGAQDPKYLWDSKWRETMREVRGQRLLQMGLGAVGTEVARQAKLMGMHVTGGDKRASFHPHCRRVVELGEVDALLPEMDVVCLTPSLRGGCTGWFDRTKLELMKDDAVLIVIGASHCVVEKDLAAVVKGGKFRGVMIDAFYQVPIPYQSPLWKIPNVLITPEVSPRPKSEEKRSFVDFRYNLRQYTYDNFGEMRNVLEETRRLIGG